MLYPYRPSAVKNRQRWNFGVLCPESYCAQQSGSEKSFMQTQCLLRTTPRSRVAIKVRFLQLVQRLIGRDRRIGDGRSSSAEGEMEFLDRLEVDGRVFQPWQEAIDRTVAFENLEPLLFASHVMEFSFPSGDSLEELRDGQGSLVGTIVRQRQSLAGSLHIEVRPCRDQVVKLTVRVDNSSNFHATVQSGRDAALLHSLVSAHVVLGVEKGEFLSLLDPPSGFEEAATQCENLGAWPVLAGDDATTMLASPIILYDYPQVAPESAGNLFDGAEIDEILSLRILTLTDQEKAEIRQSDDRARELLDRTEHIPEEQFMKLHGVLRGLTTLKEGTP